MELLLLYVAIFINNCNLVIFVYYNNFVHCFFWSGLGSRPDQFLVARAASVATYIIIQYEYNTINITSRVESGLHRLNCLTHLTHWATHMLKFSFYRLEVRSLTRLQHHILMNTCTCAMMSYGISGSHTDPFDPLKHDPGDPDCPGYPTHFQPTTIASSFVLHKIVWLPINISYQNSS